MTRRFSSAWWWSFWLSIVAVTCQQAWARSNNNNVTPPSSRTIQADTSTNNQTCETTESRWSEHNVQQVLEAWNFTDEQQWQFMELHSRLSDINHWKNDPAELARFIKEHNFHVEKAETMFRAMIEWRRDNHVDTFMERYGQPPTLFHYAPLFLLKGLDHDGDPIFVQRIGVLDGWGMYHKLGDTAMMDALLFVSEVHTSRDVGIPEQFQWQKQYYEPVAGRRVTQFTILVDLEGLSMQLLRPALLSIVQRSARIGQDYYPGLAKRIILVRGPRLFHMAWKIAVNFYDQRVHDKFIFSGKDDYLQVLSQYMDLDVLPPVLYPEGGKGSPMPGFFEKIHMEGGPLPDHTDDDDDDNGDDGGDDVTTTQTASNPSLLPDMTAAASA